MVRETATTVVTYAIDIPVALLLLATVRTLVLTVTAGFGGAIGALIAVGYNLFGTSGGS